MLRTQFDVGNIRPSGFQVYQTRSGNRLRFRVGRRQAKPRQTGLATHPRSRRTCIPATVPDCSALPFPSPSSDAGSLSVAYPNNGKGHGRRGNHHNGILLHSRLSQMLTHPPNAGIGVHDKITVNPHSALPFRTRVPERKACEAPVKATKRKNGFSLFAWEEVN